MHQIKRIVEDFIVKEKSTVEPLKQGKFTYFILKKKNYNTIDALQLIARRLKLPLKKFSFAGNKDKKAITEQVCSVEGIGSKIENIKSPEIEIIYLGKGDAPVSLGNLEGNFFEIVVRNISKKPKPINSFINYFGDQRFGINNIEVGLALIKKDFEKACHLMNKIQIKEYLKEHPTNFIAAIRQIPKRLLKLYLGSYQSYIWNATVKELIRKKKTLPKEIPIIGFGSEIENSAVKKIIDKLVKIEKITFRDFIIKEIPNISAEGYSREIKTSVKNLVISELEDDDFNTNKKKFKITFFLKKGCYATEFIKQLFEVRK